MNLANEFGSQNIAASAAQFNWAILLEIEYPDSKSTLQIHNISRLMSVNFKQTQEVIGHCVIPAFGSRDETQCLGDTLVLE